ncbi:P-loop containing nucleoside triphosphate hydrolase protein [Hypoxylon trugodes]|uniref:P-loop containing nucleoside triphosphate hydrolase protein n=1 Tax=Hypoxylon trugodes TaxID=326681 RepID=UPI002190BC9A|nr:P-loop containing nucleoside triphosphate hydrolase protein [Hypoxylon trugodes]KAI1389238.1 P-loop containing nucleoside triphosphate hydrolase protein [Hypoxylon trugodes]
MRRPSDSMADDGTATPTKNQTTETETKPPQRTPAISDYLRIFTYATKWDFCVYAIAAVASIGAGVAMPLMNIIFGQLVGQFTNYFKDATTISRGEFDQILSRQSLYIMGLFLARWGLTSINKFCFRMIGIRMSSAIRRHYLQSLLAQSIHAIDTMPTGAPATAITATSATLQIGISERLGTFLQFTATIFGAIIVAFIWSWDLTLVTSSLMLYILVVLSFAVPLIVKGQTETIQADTQGTAIASEALQGIRLVMACGAQSRIISRYEKWVQEALKKAQKIPPVVGIQLCCVFFGIFGAFGLAFWYGARRYSVGAIDNAGVVIVVLMSVMMILTSVERISTPLIAVSKAMVAACELFTVIDAPLPSSGSLKPDITGEDLVFTDVSFSYPSRPGVKVLDMLSFRIRHGQNTALVGPSGSGKSTIVALLERWYTLNAIKPSDESNDEKTDQPEESEVPVEPESTGSITVGNHNLQDIDLYWWRTQIGLVQQEPFLFNDTIFGNVANGLIGTEFAEESEERKRDLVQEACQEAYAHEFIDLLPEKYDTKVGDGGMKLSGGQKQRIAIARSIIKKPRILILDEATSAIDVRGERIVQDALDRVSQGRTTITIAHRLSTIKKADHIVVLQKGRAVEEGTHTSLLANENGVYSGLVKAQSLQLANDEEQPDALPQTYDTKSEKAASESNDAATHIEVTLQTTAKNPRSLVRAFSKLLYDQRVYVSLYLGALASSMSTAAGTPIQAWLFAKVIGVFLLQGDELKKQSNFWGLMWFALAGGVGLSYLALGWFSLRAQYFVSAAYKMRYLTDMLYQKPSFFDEDSHSHGTLTSQIAGDAKQLEDLFGVNMVSWLAGVWTVVGCIIISLIFGWKLGLVATFVTMPIMLASGFWKFRHEVQFDQMNSAVFLESSQFATEAINAIRTVSSLTMESTINNRYQKLLQGHVQKARRKAQWTAALYGFAESASLGCQALVFYYGGRLLSTGEYSLEAFFVCFMAIIQGAEGAATVLANAPSAAQAAMAANRIFDMEESANIDEGETEKSVIIPESDDGIRIEFRDVHFKYPTRDVSVFEGLNLRIEKGQYAALVGPSGSGKSTIISLLERFYDLESNQGAILCNDTNVNDLGVYGYRQNLSLVAQEPTMFRGTVRDNILFGVTDPSSISEERIHEVCRDAFIHEFIMSLPEGYDTDIGQKEISGGQKQRIAIARALIRNPKILLLDEATSALDSESEKIVQAALEKARTGRTMVAVAHRLSTIQTADIIFVLEHGKVVEKGTHSELVKQQGVYWEMCQSQALDQ